MFRSFLTSGLAQATQRIKYLFRDTFSVDASAPLGSPQACDVVGSWTIVDTENKLSKSGGKLNFSPNAVPDFGSPRIYRNEQFSKSCGLALIFSENRTGYALCGFSLDINAPTALSVSFSAVSNISAYALNVGAQLGPYTRTKIAIVMGTLGGKWLVKEAGNWKLIWVNVTAIIPNTNLVFSFYNSTGTLEKPSVLQLPAPFNTDYGIATQRLAGARAAGDTFVHEADCLIEWTVTTLPSDVGVINLRQQDANNRWAVYQYADGRVRLYEFVAGSPAPAQRGEGAAGSIANGQRMVVIADGAVIKVYANNVWIITYSYATNFQTATAGKLLALGTGGAVSDIVSWPLRLSGTALAVMERYSK